MHLSFWNEPDPAAGFAIWLLCVRDCSGRNCICFPLKRLMWMVGRSSWWNLVKLTLLQNTSQTPSLVVRDQGASVIPNIAFLNLHTLEFCVEGGCNERAKLITLCTKVFVGNHNPACSESLSCNTPTNTTCKSVWCSLCERLPFFSPLFVVEELEVTKSVILPTLGKIHKCWIWVSGDCCLS